MPTILDTFKPFRGDLFYGCDADRERYLRYIEKAYWWGDFHHVSDMWLMPNDYNNNTILSFSQYYTPGEKNDHDKEKQKEMLKASAKQSADKTVTSTDAAYKAKVQDYNQKLGEKFVEGLYQKYDPADVKSMSPDKLARDGDSPNFKMIRRSCKYGFEHVLKCISDNHTPYAKIHFILDGMNIDDVVSKKKFGQGKDARVPITTSELRFCFRNWSRLQAVVKFYKGFHVIPAPWESKPDSWYEYALERADKLHREWKKKPLPDPIPISATGTVAKASATLEQVLQAGNYFKSQAGVAVDEQ